jgi:hypothetical protein
LENLWAPSLSTTTCRHTAPLFGPGPVNMRPSVTWILAVIKFSRHNIVGLQNMIWRVYWQKNCSETITYHFQDSTQSTNRSLSFSVYLYTRNALRRVSLY